MDVSNKNVKLLRTGYATGYDALAHNYNVNGKLRVVHPNGYGNDVRVIHNSINRNPYDKIVSVVALWHSEGTDPLRISVRKHITIRKRGSGVIIDGRKIMTAAHILYDPEYGSANTVVVYVDSKMYVADSMELTDGYEPGRTDKDVAYIGFNETRFSSWIPVATKEVMESCINDFVKVYGYPDVPPYNGYMAYMQGKVVKEEGEIDGRPMSYVCINKCGLLEGASGGPWLYKMNGARLYVVGITSEVWERDGVVGIKSSIVG